LNRDLLDQILDLLLIILLGSLPFLSILLLLHSDSIESPLELVSLHAITISVALCSLKLLFSMVNLLVEGISSVGIVIDLELKDSLSIRQLVIKSAGLVDQVGLDSMVHAIAILDFCGESIQPIVNILTKPGHRHWL
jgi:hypothetical protein